MLRKTWMFALVLLGCSHAAMGAPCAGFTDVDSTSAFCVNVQWMKNRGITLGCTATLYCPNQFVTRLQMAAFMYRLGFQNTVLQGGNAFGGTAVFGTTDNFAVELHSGGLRVVRYEPDVNGPNVIGGHAANNVTSGVYGATIAGGGLGTTPNWVTDAHGTVGGGFGNIAGDDAGLTIDAQGATVGGGFINTAGGAGATVAGGGNNTASGRFSVVAGGRQNIASGEWSTVSGGEDNVASGLYSTVAGGNSNIASGFNSFAAGLRAQALHARSFVWGGSGAADTLSQADGDFVVYAPGAVRLYAGPLGGGGCILSSGSSGWFCASDRALKSDIKMVDGREVLDRVVALPIARWSFTSVPGVMHMGPMAQDFHVAFRLGDDPTRLAPMDVQGVALAAIQGLNAKLEAQAREIAELRRAVERLLVRTVRDGVVADAR